MSPKLILCIIGVLLSVKAFASFIIKTLSAKRFCKKIALPHGFAEGVMTGMYYPLLLISLFLLLAQTVIFFVIPSKNEITAILRLFIFILTAIAYGCFDRRTPALRAYWFGKSSMYETHSERGKISYSDVYGAKVSKKISLSGTNGQQLCKISFFVKDKSFFFGRKKYVCKMTVYAINELANHIEFNNKEQKQRMAPSFKKRVLSFALSVLLTLMTFSIALPFFSFGILNEKTYSRSDIVLSEPLKTVAPISDIAFIDGMICVYYEKIEMAELYDTDGNFRYALAFPSSDLKSSDFSVTDGSVNYHYGDTLIRYYPSAGNTEEENYSIEHTELFGISEAPAISDSGTTYTHDGNSVFRKSAEDIAATEFITRSPFNMLFDVEVMWVCTALLLTLAFIIHFILTDRTKNDTNRRSKNKRSNGGNQNIDPLPSDWTA